MSVYQQSLTSPSAWVAYAHLMRHFGDPVRVLELPEPAGFRARKLDVAQFSPLGSGSTALLGTCGASNTAMPNGKFSELFLLVRPAPTEELAQDAARLLRRVSFSAVTQNVTLEPGLRLRLPSPSPAFGRFDHCILFPPLPMVDSFRVMNHQDGKSVTWHWVVPLFAHEAKLAKEHGADSLYARFAMAQIDLANLERPALFK